MSEGKQLFTGPCIGGPMNGQEGQSRYPKGFLLVDKGLDEAWLYEYSAESGKFVSRYGSPMKLNQEARLRAARGFTYDVRTVDR